MYSTRDKPALRMRGGVFLLASGVLCNAACHVFQPAHPELEYGCSCSSDPDAAEQPGCLARDGDGYRMHGELLKRLKPQTERVFSVRSNCGFFWVRPDGYAMPTIAFDNWADYFCDGLTRTPRGERVGFMDTTLTLVVPPIYEYATPFRGGRAAVCLQCSKQAQGEHTAVGCAHCGVVDSRGQWVEPVGPDSTAIQARLPPADTVTDDECTEPQP
jgi:hypothetical protein